MDNKNGSNSKLAWRRGPSQGSPVLMRRRVEAEVHRVSTIRGVETGMRPYRRERRESLGTRVSIARPGGKGRKETRMYDRWYMDAALRTMRKVVESIAAKGGQILVVGGSPRANGRWSGDSPSEAWYALEGMISSKGRLPEGGRRVETRETREERTGVNRLRKKWQGGLLTNFDSFLQYTTPHVEREKQGYDRASPDVLRGMKPMTVRKKLPDRVLFMDALSSQGGIQEAYQTSIPRVGFVSQEVPKACLDKLDYRIPGNNRTVSGQARYMHLILLAYREGRAKQRAEPGQVE